MLLFEGKSAKIAGVGKSEQNLQLKTILHQVSYSPELIDLQFSYPIGIEDDISTQRSTNTASTEENKRQVQDKPIKLEKNEIKKSDGVCNTSSGKLATNHHLPQKLSSVAVDGLVRSSLSAGRTGVASTFEISLPNTIKKRSKIQRRSRW